MKSYCILFTLLFSALLANAQNHEPLSYAGSDAAEVLFTLYLSSHPSLTPDDIVTALEVDLDALSLDDLRIELVKRAALSSEQKPSAPIHTLWGNTLDVVFNLKDQTLSLGRHSPFERALVKKILSTIKAANKDSRDTYQNVASRLHEAWLTPFSYTQRAIHAWLSEDTIPEYESLQRAYTILSNLDGTYTALEQNKLFEHALKTVSRDQLKTIMNLTQARALYSEGNRYKEMTLRVATTNLRNSAAEASKLAQAAAIHRILTGKAQETLEEQLILARKKVHEFKKAEDDIYQQYLSQNKTQRFNIQQSHF